ncbi:MAG TPA: extracellular solute-binding protein, partial [Spirochaetia bacterium]|nr:extracellular solute-binding protein [Spirochaetia bacterium]
MKRIIVALTIAVLACAALGAQAKDPLGKYSPTITITTVKSQGDSVKFDEGEDYNNNIWTRGYLSYLGIKGQVLWAVPTSQFQQKMNISIAANDLPDIIPADLRQFKQLVDMGVATDMTQIFAGYVSPLTKQMFDLDQGVALGQATIKGKLMGIPQLAGNGDTPAVIWIRADWLKKLGLQPPKTMADLFAIMDAFTNKDPNGDGQKNTYGLALEKNLLGGGLHDLDGFFNGYHAYANDADWVKDDSGKLVYGTIQPQVRQGLAKLAELYKNGEIDPEFAVKDASKVTEFTTSGRLGVEFGQHWNSFWPLQDSKNKDPNADWKPYPLVSIDSKPAMPIT